MEKEDDSESDCFWGFVRVFRDSDLLGPVWQSVETMAALAKRKRLVAVKLEMKTTKETTIRMNLKKPREVGNDGQVRLFCSSLAGAGGWDVVCGCGFGEGSKCVWRGRVVGEAGSSVRVDLAKVDGSFGFSVYAFACNAFDKT